MNKEEIIEKYIKKLKKILQGTDYEVIHGDYDCLLEQLIRELGYNEIIDYANKLCEERDITFWYA